MSSDLTRLPDAELLRSLKALVRDERRHVVSVLRHLAEMERRRLAYKEGYRSLFEYCRRELRYAEGETARRIHASRAAARFPILYRAIDRGLLSLTTVSMLAPLLTRSNFRRLIRSAMGRSTREVERLVAAENPMPERRERVRIISVAPSPAAAEGPGSAEGRIQGTAAGNGVDLDLRPEAPEFPAGTDAAPLLSGTSGGLPLTEAAPDSRPADGAPRGAARVRFSFTGDEDLLAAVERAKELLRHRHPFGGLEEVFTEAVAALLERLDPHRRAERARSCRKSPGTRDRNPVTPQAVSNPPARRRRSIPQAVKVAVWRRDEGRCAYVSASGRRCGAAGDLEYDHVTPWARGGRSDDPANIRLLCRGHNGLEARREFGDGVVDAAIARSRPPEAGP